MLKVCELLWKKAHHNAAFQQCANYTASMIIMGATQLFSLPTYILRNLGLLNLKAFEFYIVG